VRELRRASAQTEIDALLVRYDGEPDGPARDKLAADIDAVAHQKYATVSRLYWHTTLASAKAAARELGRPILHLRLLGKLDEDLSCANSRLLYGIGDLSDATPRQVRVRSRGELTMPRAEPPPPPCSTTRAARWSFASTTGCRASYAGLADNLTR
jgi:hypothetical protein